MKLKLLFISLIISLLAMSCSSLAGSQPETINKQVQISGKISAIDRYGNITLTITTEELLERGFYYGDEVLILADNGYMTNARISTEYSLDSIAIIKTGLDTQPISASINYGNLAEEGDLSLGEVIKFSLINSSRENSTTNSNA